MARNYDPDTANTAHVLQICAGFLREAGLIPTPGTSGLSAVHALENPLAPAGATSDSRYIALGEAVCRHLRELGYAGAQTGHRDAAGNIVGAPWVIVGPGLFDAVIGTNQPARQQPGGVGGSWIDTAASVAGTLASTAAGSVLGPVAGAGVGAVTEAVTETGLEWMTGVTGPPATGSQPAQSVQADDDDAFGFGDIVDVALDIVDFVL